MPDSLKDKLGPLGGIVGTIIFLVSTIVDFTGLFTQYHNIIKWLMVISAIVVLFFGFYLFGIYKKIVDYKENSSQRKILEEKVSTLEKRVEGICSELIDKRSRCNFLELLVCDGKKFIENKATITFDIKGGKYYLSFEKRYIIISEAIKWYEGQFYSNVVLENAEKSQEYYKTNQVDWNTLNIAAELKYQNQGDKSFSGTKQVKVLQVAEGNNYKKFHIQYRTKDNDKLPIRQGAEIQLTYSYEVPVALWGSYLNRYISYWGEVATVKVTCKDETPIQVENFKVYQTDNQTGEKYICEEATVSKDRIHNRTVITFTLPQKPASQYSIWWDADKIFGTKNRNTNMTADKSQLTHY